MSTFYTGVDKQRYDAGEKFLPMNKFLASYTAPTTNVEEEVTTSYGIPNTNAFTYNNNQNYYPGKTSNLVSNFNRDIQAYNERVKEGNRPLREAQFPSFPNISNAQNIYNRSQGYLDKGYPGTHTDTSMHGKSLSEINKMANEQIMDHHEKARTGQFGPSYIEAEKPTWSRRISDFAYDHIPGINRPQSYEDIMTSGYIQPRGMIPGIMGIMSNFGLKNYAGLPQADQAFIASKRGYTGPTIFGENTTGTNKDPFGINVDSMFGNYADYSKKESARLDEQIEKSQKNYIDKYGSLDDENEFGKSWYEMNKVTLARKGLYNQNVKDFQNITSDLSLIDQARAYDRQQTQAGIDKDENKINRDAAKGDSKSGASTVNPNSAYGKKHGYTGGSANPHTQSGWSGSSKSSSSKGKGRDKDDRMATGGRVGLNYGGLASMLGREGFKTGGRQDRMGGTMEQTAQELREAAPDQFGGGMTIGHGGGDGPDNKDRKKLSISPVIESKWSDLGFTYPTGVFGFDTSTPIGKFRAKMNLKNYVMGDDTEPTLDYQGNIGPVDINATYSDDVQNINAFINNNNLTAGINYDAITGDPTFGIHYSKTFKHGGLARLL